MAEREEDAAAEAPAPKKRRGSLVIILAALLVLGGGGGAAWWFFGARAHAAPQEPPLETRGLVKFEPFLVNLTDSGGNRFLKATIGLVVETEAVAKHVEEKPVVEAHLRSSILEILTQQAAPALVTPDGKEALKKTIREKTSAILKDEKVIDVLFSEFVVQF